MNKVLIASSNPHKIIEIKFFLEHVPSMKVLSLPDFGINVDVVEDGTSLEQNSFIKARAIYKLLEIPSLADDTGLFVDALDGEPGVYSARYAGVNATYEENCEKLLKAMERVPERERVARFKSVLCYMIDIDNYYFFRGNVEGKIIREKRGENGFGYDPVFLPQGSDRTFAELTDEEKNIISHRAIALQKFKEFIVLDLHREH